MPGHNVRPYMRSASQSGSLPGVQTCTLTMSSSLKTMILDPSEHRLRFSASIAESRHGDCKEAGDGCSFLPVRKHIICRCPLNCHRSGSDSRSWRTSETHRFARHVLCLCYPPLNVYMLLTDGPPCPAWWLVERASYMYTLSSQVSPSVPRASLSVLGHTDCVYMVCATIYTHMWVVPAFNLSL